MLVGLQCLLYCRVGRIAMLVGLLCWLYCSVGRIAILVGLLCWLYCSVGRIAELVGLQCGLESNNERRLIGYQAEKGQQLWRARRKFEGGKERQRKKERNRKLFLFVRSKKTHRCQAGCIN